MLYSTVPSRAAAGEAAARSAALPPASQTLPPLSSRSLHGLSSPPRPQSSSGVPTRRQSASPLGHSTETSTARSLRSAGGGGPQPGSASAWARVRQLRQRGRVAVQQQANTAAGLADLRQALELQCAAPGGLRETVPGVEPAWACGEELVALANRAALHCGLTAGAVSETQLYLREAVRLVVSADPHGCEWLGSDPLNLLVAAPVPATTAASRRREPDCFAARPRLKSALGAVVLSTVAAQLQSQGQPAGDVLQQLRWALLRTDGVLCTGELYNLAAALAGMGRVKDAVSAATHCLELCSVYLRIDPSGDGASAREARERAAAYSSFVVLVASHFVSCQLLLASLAWCGDARATTGSCAAPRGRRDCARAEQRHCAEAAACARTFLPASHLLHRRCAARLSAASARCEEEYQTAADASVPSCRAPQLPLLALYADCPYSSTPMLLECVDELESSEVAGADTAATAPSAPPATVSLSRLLALCEGTRPPGGLLIYLQLTAKRATAYSSKHVRTASSPAKHSASGERKGVSPGPRPRVGAASAASESAAQTPSRTRARAMQPPLIVMAVPRATLNRYKSLKQTALHYLDHLAAADRPDDETGIGAAADVGSRHSAGPAAPLSSSRAASTRSARGDDVSSPAETEPVAATGGQCHRSISPSEHVRTLDRDLLRYSQLVPDAAAEAHARAVCCLQRRWRCRAAVRARQQRAGAVANWMTQQSAGDVIVRACGNYVACRPARRERADRAAARAQTQRAELIQRYVRGLESVEQWGKRCLAAYQQRLAEKERDELHHACATLLQSCWRMYSARQSYRRKRQAVATLTSAWRCVCARRTLVRLRALKRLELEQYYRPRRPQAVVLQRWYRACCARRAVADVLPRKQLAVRAAREADEAQFEALMGKYGAAADRVGAAAHRIAAVLRGAAARASLRPLHAARQRMRTAVHRWLLRVQGRWRLEAMRRERAERLRQQRRQEEVLVATRRVQRATRLWLARRAASRDRRCRSISKQQQQQQHVSAGRIQAAYRAYRERCQRRRAADSADQTTLVLLEQRDGRGGASQLRARSPLTPRRSATKIQAAYRGHRTRVACGTGSLSALAVIHRAARCIQCAWRQSEARSAAAQRRWLAHELHRAHQEEALYRMAVVRAQSVVRMYLARKRVLENCRLEVRGLQPAPSVDGSSAALEDRREERNNAKAADRFLRWRTPHQQLGAARVVQRVWRGYAARHYAQQLRLATAQHARAKTAAESLFAYAVLIQKTFRGWLARAGGRGRHAELLGVPREGIRSAVRVTPVQSALRAGDAATAPLLAASVSESMVATAPAEALVLTNPLIQSCPSALQRRSGAEREAALTELQSTVSSVALVGAGQPPVSSPDEVAVLARLPASHALTPYELCVAREREDAERRRSAAAVQIQRVWRGYCVRSTLAYYAASVTPEEPALPAGAGGRDCRQQAEEQSVPSVDAREQPFQLLHSSPVMRGCASASLMSGSRPWSSLTPRLLSAAQRASSRPVSATLHSSVAPALAADVHATVASTAPEDDGSETTRSVTMTTTTTITVASTHAATPSPPPHSPPAGPRPRQQQQRGAPASTSAPSRNYTAAHAAAAVLIQKIWRGYQVRCSYEYYYEEYEEEVSVELDDDGNEV